jgi:hypothetical protein
MMEVYHYTEMDIKEKILQCIETHSLLQLKIWLLHLQLSEKENAIALIQKIGEQALIGKFSTSPNYTLQNFRQYALHIEQFYNKEAELFAAFEGLRAQYKLGTTKLMHLYPQKKMYMVALAETQKPYAKAFKKLIAKFLQFEEDFGIFDADSWIFE